MTLPSLFAEVSLATSSSGGTVSTLGGRSPSPRLAASGASMLDAGALSLRDATVALSGESTATRGWAPWLRRHPAWELLHDTFTCDPDVFLLGVTFPNEQDAAFAVPSPPAAADA